MVNVIYNPMVGRLGLQQNLGVFEGFPEDMVQACAEFSHLLPARRLQFFIVEALKDLNGYVEVVDPDIIATTTPITCRFEVGIAEGKIFNFLSEDELKRFKKLMKNRICKILDFLVCIFYRYKREDGKEVSLWSDFHHVRFNLEGSKTLEVKVHHFKGTRKLPLNVLIRKIVDRINEKILVEGLKPLHPIRIVGH